MWAACLLAAAVCGTTVINDVRGPTVLDGALGPYLIEAPASLGKLTIFNAAEVRIVGGSVGAIELYGDSLEIFGGTLRGNLFAWDGTTIDLYVRDITPESLADIARLSHEGGGRFGAVAARLASGEIWQGGIGIAIDGRKPVWNVLHVGDSWLDAGGDGLLGLDELNAVRNTFGGDAAAGDFTLDGAVGINDLNVIRNHFGTAYFPARRAAAVPEADAGEMVCFLISGAMLGMLAQHAFRRRRSR